MAHWFHRNPLKATSAMTFDFGTRATATTSSSRNVCTEIRLARANLMKILPDPNQDVETLQLAAEKYIGLLLGFIDCTDPPAGQQKSQPSAPPPEGEEESPDASQTQLTGRDSKLRNAMKITWSNSLGGKNISQQDFVFELINMLMNIALWYTKHAAKLAGASVEISEDDAKEVHKCLRTAAGIFTFVQDNLIPRLFERTEEGTDLDPRILEAYVIQCTAEAQEVTVARAIELKHNNSLISSLAYETAMLFRKSGDSLKTLDESMVAKWRMYCMLKCAIYLAYAHCYNGQTLLAQDKCGEAIRALRESTSMYQKAGNLCKEYHAAKGAGTSAKPEQHPFFRRLGPLVKRILDKCEHENGFIYHQKVAEELPELHKKATYGLASALTYELPAKSAEWTWEAYSGFSISAPSNKDEKKKEKDEPVQPVKEIPVENTDKDPNTRSGCTIS